MSRSKLNYKIYNGKNIKALFEYKRTLILSLLFSAGLIIGAIMLDKESLVTDNICEYILKKTDFT